MRRILTTAAAMAFVGTLGACTRQEVQMWRAWHANDPKAAEAFADDVDAPLPSEVGVEPL